MPGNGFVCADVNMDGQINVLDIITLVNYIMGGSPDPFDEDAADVNADDFINVLDIIFMVNIIMQAQGMPCGCVAPVTYEGKTYATVQIGEQCWFRENLNVGTMILSSGGGSLQTNNGTIEKYCYDNLVANCDIYGGLYEWNEAMQYETAEGASGICPPGWHIPKDSEWDVLINLYDGWENAAGSLKEAGYQHWNPPNTGATNNSGFTALPGGFRRVSTGSFNETGYKGLLWSSTPSGLTDAWTRNLYNNYPLVDRTTYGHGFGLSIRCLKGCEPQPSQANAGSDQLNLPGTSTQLAGNTPASGDGMWSVITGTGGTLLAPSSPYSGFQGVAGNSYTLVWTISTVCGSTSDTVLISFVSSGGFTCGESLVDERDDQSYPTIQIGVQCWMAENLNVGTMIQSSGGGFLQTNNGTIEKYCYDNLAANCDIYGGLYEWNEAMQYMSTEGSQGICPEGWHVPSDAALKILEGTVDSQFGIGDAEWDTFENWRGSDAGGNLKESGFAHWQSPNEGATNASGFTALPGGFRDRTEGFFNNYTSFACFWSSTQDDDDLAMYRVLAHNFASSLYGMFYKDNGFSIRCLKNCQAPPSQANAGPDQTNLPEPATTLAGNAPVSGTGIWTIVSGTGGTIVDPQSPTSIFNGLAGHQYTLSWTIYTACDLSQDLVDVSIANSGVPTCETLVDSRDGQTYETIQIGYQCWMAQNLNIGEDIESQPGGQRQTDNQVIEKYCSNDLWLNCETYGGLYEWDEAMQYVTTERVQGICPFGWHMPADFEFSMLSENLGGDQIAGGKMKATGTVEEGTGLWYAPNTGATNSSGFTGIPQGYRDTDGGFYSLGYYGDYWTSTQYDPEDAWFRSLDYEMTDLYRDHYTRIGGSAVRCVKDCTPFPIKANAGPDQVLVPGTSTTLAGNIPTSGSGQWTIINGTGGTFTDPLNPMSNFQGQACTEYVLRWTITTVCGYTFDYVTIVFAPDEPFSCGGPLEDCRDGKTYNTVQIGTQCWMAENLNIGTMVLNNDDGQLQNDNGVIEKYCYDDNPGNCETYGGLYEWREAMQYSDTEGIQGICPYGWHLPSDDEWSLLKEFLGGEDLAGGKMKSVGTVEEGTGLWYAPNTAATNESGFTALPSGYRDFSFGGYFAFLGESCDFWTSTQSNYNLAFYHTLYHNSGAIDRETLSKFAGFGIRCVQTCTPQPTPSDAGPDQVIPGTTGTILQGNTPSSGTGLWTVVSGSGGTVVDPADPNSEFQGTQGNVYILAWTITTSCGSSTDRVIIYFSPCQNENNDYTFADLTDPLSYEGNSWTDAGWADVNISAAENQIISCLIVTASKLCSDGYPEEVTMYLKSPAGTVIQIWEGFEENGCTDDFIFMTEAFDGESSQGQWILYFEDAWDDGGAICIGAVLHIGH